jgi:hypothetical protein
MDTQMELSTLEPFPLYVAASDQSNVCENTQDGCCCEGVRPPRRHLSTQLDVSSWTTEDLDDLDAFFEDIRHTDDEEEHGMDDDVYRLGAGPDDQVFNTSPTTRQARSLEDRMQRLEQSVCILLQNEHFLLQQQREAARRSTACFLDIQTLMNIAEKQRAEK